MLEQTRGDFRVVACLTHKQKTMLDQLCNQLEGDPVFRERVTYSSVIRHALTRLYDEINQHPTCVGRGESSVE